MRAFRGLPRPILQRMSAGLPPRNQQCRQIVIMAAPPTFPRGVVSRLQLPLVAAGAGNGRPRASVALPALPCRRFTDNSAAGALEKRWGKSRIKALWKQYGIVFVVTYFSMYFATLGGCYAAVKSHMVTLNFLNQVLEYLHLTGSVDTRTATGDFALAWLMAKITEPVRMAVTIVIVPPIARTLGYAPKGSRSKSSIDAIAGAQGGRDTQPQQQTDHAADKAPGSVLMDQAERRDGAVGTAEEAEEEKRKSADANAKREDDERKRD
jgi:hypothetical protein